jgi:arylsulfatase A-like enzyme
MQRRKAPNRYVLIALALAIVGFGAAMSACGGGDAVPSPTPGASGPTGTPDQYRKPNIVFILMDDMNLTDFLHLRYTQEHLVRKGTFFPQHTVDVPLCCPSRVSTLRGQYAHNHGVLTNQPPRGGFSTFLNLGLEAETIGTWLQSAGYRTAFIGKYLNGYNDRQAHRLGLDIPETHVPPGWDRWVSTGGNNIQDYPLNIDGAITRMGRSPEELQTVVTARYALDFVRQAARDGQPFFVFVSPYAPHGPWLYPPEDARLFADQDIPRPPSFNEADVSDKPPAIQALPTVTEPEIRQGINIHQRRLRSMQPIDRLIRDLVEVLREAGQLENTYIILTSDNGYLQGPHRIPSGKGWAYEESVRIGMVVRGPGMAAGATVGTLTANIDFAATFAEIAGFTAPFALDGRTFVGENGGATETGRRSLFIASYANREAGDSGDAEAVGRWVGFRTPRMKYVEWEDGFRELYDLVNDPYELDNLAVLRPEIDLAPFSAYLAALRTCAGASCRAAEDAEPPPLP